MVSSVSNAATGSSALVSSRVSTSESLSPFSPAGGQQLVEGDDVDERDLAEDRVQVLELDAQLVGDLGLGRRAVQLGLEGGVGLLDLARLVADRARDPVDRAELVDDRALDAADRVGLELDGPLEVELLDRVDQPEDAVGDEVGLLDVGRQAHADAAGDVLHQRRVVQDQPLAQPLFLGGLVVAPQHRDGGLDLGALLVGDPGVAAGAPYRLGRLAVATASSASLSARRLRRRQ